jgi:hypothetical protein
VVGFTTGSRGEVSGKRKPVIREQNDNDYGGGGCGCGGSGDDRAN